MRRSERIRAAVIAAGLTAALALGACSADPEKGVGALPPLTAEAPWHPERNPLWQVPRNGANQPVDREWVPLPGYALGPH